MNNIKNDINLREAVRRREHQLPPMPANLNKKVMGSLTPKSLPLTPSEGRGTQSRFSSLSLWRGAGVRLAGLIAASIVLLLVFHYNNKVAPTQQPVVAEVVQPESPQPVREPAPEPASEPVVAQPKAQGKSKARVARTDKPVAVVKQDQKPAVAEENLLAEATTPQEQTEDLPVLPPERQALVDMFLAEEALQVFYMQQEQTKELRAFTAGLEGKEPETTHLIIAF